MCISQPVLLVFVGEKAGDTSCPTLELMSNKAFSKLVLMSVLQSLQRTAGVRRIFLLQS